MNHSIKELLLSKITPLDDDVFPNINANLSVTKKKKGKSYNWQTNSLTSNQLSLLYQN